MPEIKNELTKAWRLATSPFRLLPDFLIPGEAKCGSSSLYDYLTQHPDIVRAALKEPGNFLRYPTSALRSRMHFTTVAHRLFRALFLRRRTVTGEASVDYLTHVRSPEDIRRILPNAKLIIIMRDPIARAFSDFQMMKRSGLESGDFDEIVRRSIEWLSAPPIAPLIDALAVLPHNPVRYVEKGLYLRHIERWTQVFPRENFLFIRSEDLFTEPAKVVQSAFEFLGLANHPATKFEVARKGGYDAGMNPDTRTALAAFYRPHNESLYAFLARDLGWERGG